MKEKDHKPTCCGKLYKRTQQIPLNMYRWSMPLIVRLVALHALGMSFIVGAFDYIPVGDAEYSLRLSEKEGFFIAFLFQLMVIKVDKPNKFFSISSEHIKNSDEYIGVASVTHNLLFIIKYVFPDLYNDFWDKYSGYFFTNPHFVTVFCMFAFYLFQGLNSSNEESCLFRFLAGFKKHLPAHFNSPRCTSFMSLMHHVMMSNIEVVSKISSIIELTKYLDSDNDGQPFVVNDNDVLEDYFVAHKLVILPAITFVVSVLVLMDGYGVKPMGSALTVLKKSLNVMFNFLFSFLGWLCSCSAFKWHPNSTLIYGLSGLTILDFLFSCNVVPMSDEPHLISDNTHSPSSDDMRGDGAIDFIPSDLDLASSDDSEDDFSNGPAIEQPPRQTPCARVMGILSWSWSLLYSFLSNPEDSECYQSLGNSALGRKSA